MLKHISLGAPARMTDNRATKNSQYFSASLIPTVNGNNNLKVLKMHTMYTFYKWVGAYTTA